MKKRVIVVGGGIVGLATAWKLASTQAGIKVTLLEKEERTGRHQSGNNSGVLHCGLAYKPGSLKAQLAVAGIHEMIDFCRRYSVPHELCGKLVVAVSDEERERMLRVGANGRKNGLKGIRELSRAEMLKLEPHAGGVAGLHVAEEGIVDYSVVSEVLTRELLDRGHEVICSAEVILIEKSQREWRIGTKDSEFGADFLINCAGLYCDRVSVMAGEIRETRIVPFRGDYFKLANGGERLVKNLIYPVPDPSFPFLGVHFTRLVTGGIEAGPNAVLAFAREGYSMRDIVIRDLWDALSFRGLWLFLARHMKMSVNEFLISSSKHLFCRALQKLVPEIQPRHLAPGGAGVRAQAMSPDGSLVQDFKLLDRDDALHVLNAPSPAATASLAIGGVVADRVQKRLN